MKSHSVTRISGSGFSGICMAIKLREAGIDNFRVIEKQPELVWGDIPVVLEHLIYVYDFMYKN